MGITYKQPQLHMRISVAIFLVAALAAAVSAETSTEVVPETFAATSVDTGMMLLQEQPFAEASSKLETTLLQLENKNKAAAKGARGGFKAYFYANVRNLSHVQQAMNAIRRRGPSRHFTVNRIAYGSTNGYWSGLNNSFRDHFVGKFTGSLRVHRTGTYNFWTTSDDGSRMYVNGRLVVNNDGLHGMRSRHGRIHLKKGYASIQVYYFERTGGAGLYAYFSGPGIGKRVMGAPYVYTYRPPSSKVGCISNAKKSISSVLHEVKNAQSILNRMDNGKHCAGKGQAAVQNAKANLRQKQAAEKNAHKNLSKSRSAKITVTVTYSSANRNCKAFTNSNAFRRARRNEQAKKNALTRAKQQVRDAKNFLKKMEAKAAADRCKCKYRVQSAAQAAVAQARKLTAERKRSITRELMLICLVKARSKKTPSARNNAGQACKRTGFPSSYNAKLALHKTKLVRMDFKCKRCGGVFCTSAHYERYTKERQNKERANRERTSKERTNKERGQKQRERGNKERANKPRDIGQIKDNCNGFRVSSVCGGNYVAIKTYNNPTWNRYGAYSCPPGWYWPTRNKYFQIMRRHGCFSNNAKSRTHYGYYSKCGWSGYTPPSRPGNNRTGRYYIRFSDSRNGRCPYQHAGNYMGYQNNYGCSTSNFLGIACVKNGY